MKKYIWNPNKFKENIIEPVVGMLAFLALSIKWFQERVREMSMVCVTGCKECTGCMDCYEQREAQEQTPKMTEEQKEDIFECLDGVKMAAMEMYEFSEDEFYDLMTEYIER